MRRSLRFHVGFRAYLGAGLGVLFILAGGLGLHARASAHPRPTTLAAHTAIDPRLIVRPHSTAVTATLAGGLRLTGDLTPSLPGMMNTLTLRGPVDGGSTTTTAAINLTLTMPGMRMFPVHATLAFHAGTYRGRLWVPMFGSYLARLSADTGSGRLAGTAVITVPIDLGATPRQDGSSAALPQ